MQKHLFVTIFMLLFISTEMSFSQFVTISEDEIVIVEQELMEGDLKDSVFWANIGFLLSQKKMFDKVIDNNILVKDNGVYFQMTVSNSADSIVASFVYFYPHSRWGDEKLNDTTFN